ncbi:MAG: ArsR family transcriptional regulator, partial [Nitrososphaerales archaeon]
MTVTHEDPRQRLLELIGKKGPITIKDLKQETGMSTGSLYHHLSKLNEYVLQ